MYCAEQVRDEIPALEADVHGRPLIYLDNAATQQMPRQVWEAVAACELRRGNVHRGIHSLSEASTRQYEEARQTIAAALKIRAEQLVFTSGATGGINQVAHHLEHRIGPNDTILVTALEHHSNFVPWQQLCLRCGASFRIVPVTGQGKLDGQALERLLTPDVKLLAVSACSNVLGLPLPVREITALAHSRSVPVLVDGAQAICHGLPDLAGLDCDYYVFSGRKLGAPFGIGALYLKAPLEPGPFGGGMVEEVRDTDTAFAPPPLCWEAGTPPVFGAVGLAAAFRFRQALPDGWLEHEAQLLKELEEGLSRLPGVRILGRGQNHMGCLSVTMDGVHPFDAAAMLDQLGIAVRSGHHCAQPLLRRLGASHALRFSPCFYNTMEEINRTVEAVERVIFLLRRN